MMRRNRGVHILKVLAIVAVALTVFGFVTMELWNWLMPAIFRLPVISFGQAIGLVALSKILLGGFHAPWGGRRHWKERMAERWMEMTPEERERFQAGMRGRCGWGRREDSTQEPKQA